MCFSSSMPKLKKEDGPGMCEQAPPFVQLFILPPPCENAAEDVPVRKAEGGRRKEKKRKEELGSSFLLPS
jgi:hypothetical protein